MSAEYNVHMSLTQNPLALRVEGLRGSLKRLTEHISKLKKVCIPCWDLFTFLSRLFYNEGIVEEVFASPLRRPISQDLVQRISRLTGAFVENVGSKGKVCTLCQLLLFMIVQLSS